MANAVHDGLTLHERTDARAIGALRDEWRALADRCERATVFQTWEWADAWWRAFGRGKRLRLIEFRAGGALVGLAPLYASRHLGTPLRRLAFVGNGPSDYLDILAPDACSAAVCDLLLRHLSTAPGFDLADLQQLAPASHLRTQWGPRLDGERLTLKPQEPCPYVALPASWEDYLKRLGKKTRGNIGYYDRLLTRTFEDAESAVADAAALPNALTALFELHQKRWNAALLPGVLGGRRTQEFHRDVAARLLERGWLRLHTIRAGGRTVAALYCFRFRDRYSYYLGGFAPDLARHSLGTVLTAHAIRQAIEEGCAEFDFLRGDEEYKQRWMPESRTNARILLARPRSLRSGAMLRLNRLENLVEHRAKAFAERQKRRRS